MFDLGWTEMVVIVIVAILIIGPKELPAVLRTIGKWVAKARALAREFQDSVNEAIRESEIEDMRKELEQVEHAAKADTPPEPPSRDLNPPPGGNKA